MKNFMSRLVLILLLANVFPMSIFSQDDLKQPIPFDPSVRKGVLANGLQYFIKKKCKT